ncbi:hypothetical protein chiPu_0018699 [Chiloscyllium punctatum]|uniref:Uncharacterized protein n=1 Tax=Chiloscyllium punctatum TaxID=137246 RepID=A0A401RQV1_CHIPU|nr:hypothetical protein [Chiloscyllium punctatum]
MWQRCLVTAARAGGRPRAMRERRRRRVSSSRAGERRAAEPSKCRGGGSARGRGRVRPDLGKCQGESEGLMMKLVGIPALGKQGIRQVLGTDAYPPLSRLLADVPHQNPAAT